MAVMNETPAPEVMKAFLDFAEHLTGHRPAEAEVFYAPVDTIVLKESNGEETPTPVGSRFLASVDGQAIAAEATIATSREPVRFRRLIRGYGAKEMFNAVHAAQRLREAQGKNLELRFLSLPSLLIDVVRLTSDRDGTDIILPMRSFDRRLGGLEPMRTGQLLPIAREIQERRKKAREERKECSS